jgi:cytochrome c peroxidase
MVLSLAAALADQAVEPFTTPFEMANAGPLRDNGTKNLSGICGQFKVPSLRNVALTAPYFHNGKLTTLEQAIGFYVRAGYLGNVNTGEIPYNRSLDADPALNPQEINDLITFLCTLTDGYDPSDPHALVLPAQCQAAAT